jgi:hypothetical protein
MQYKIKIERTTTFGSFHAKLCSHKLWGCIQIFLDWVDNKISNNKRSLRSNRKGYGGKIHYTDSQNSDTTAPNGRELYCLQFLLQTASPETFGYTLIYHKIHKKICKNNVITLGVGWDWISWYCGLIYAYCTSPGW